MIRSATRLSKAAVRHARLGRFRPTCRAGIPQITVRQFSNSLSRKSTSSADQELVSALRAEQDLEQKTANELAEDQGNIADWPAANGFEIIESPGNEQVQLVKKVSSDETLRVYFSISDVVNAENLFDETARFPRQDDADGEIVEEEEELETPVRVNIIVEKSKGALSIEGVVQDDLVLVESVIPYSSGEFATKESAEADYSRRQIYQGPPFGVLDPSVQSAIQNFLEARKLDGDFALFVQEYSSFRENKEYVDWLGRIAAIVE